MKTLILASFCLSSIDMYQDESCSGTKKSLSGCVPLRMGSMTFYCNSTQLLLRVYTKPNCQTDPSHPFKQALAVGNSSCRKVYDEAYSQIMVYGFTDYKCPSDAPIIPLVPMPSGDLGYTVLSLGPLLSIISFLLFT